MPGKTLFKDLFIYFISLLAVVGLHCCTRAFSSCSEWALLFFVVCGLLIAVPSLIAEHAGHGRHAGCSSFYTLASVAVALGLQSVGSVVVACGLVTLWHGGIFLDQRSNWYPLHCKANS